MESLRNMDTVQKIILGIVVASLIVAIIVLFKNSKKAIKIEQPVEQNVNEKEQEIIQDLPPRRTQQQQPQSQESSGMLVMFFAPWCGHCKTLEPIWDELIQNFDGYNGIKIVKIQGEQQPKIMELHQVQGFPTVKYCPHGLDNPTGIVYNGDRSMDSIIQFLQQCGKIQQ